MSLTTLLIARHGNTFGPGDALRRVGARTDLPLVESGIVQARTLGIYLRNNNLLPDIVYTSPLARAKATAQHALSEASREIHAQTADFLMEIDFGQDDGALEADVRARLGGEALDAWDHAGIMPPGWSPRPEAIVAHWQEFAAAILARHTGGRVLAVTSNGIARFAGCLAGDLETFWQTHTPKIATGALCRFDHTPETGWTCAFWNLRP